MSDNEVVDYYEILEISPNANTDTIDKIFRYLAQRYHQDGNTEKFNLIVKAHETLRDPKKRAEYDVIHKSNSEYHWNLVEEAGDMANFENDEVIQVRLLAVMYIKRKRNIHNCGSGILELEKLTGCPNELLNFHLWYLRGKGWVVRMEDGLLTITAEGVDKALANQHTIRAEASLSD